MGLSVRAAGATLALLLAAVLPFPAAAQPAALEARSDEARLLALFATANKREDALDPLARLYRGDPVEATELAILYTDRLDAEKIASATEALASLARIDRARLSPARQISYDAFAFNKRAELAMLRPAIRALTVVQPFTHFGGFPMEFATAMAAGGAMPYESEADYRRALRLNEALPAVLDQSIVRFRQGLASGVVEPRLTVEAMIAQLDGLLALKPEDSPFATPLRNFPATVPAPARERIRQAYLTAVRERINPAYLRLQRFLSNEYLPRARSTIGLSAIRSGGALYRQLIERETTKPLEPDAIHRTGLSEVARIQRQMDRVRKELGFKGTLPEFFESIRTDPTFHPKSADELARGYEAIAKAVQAQIPTYFAQVPRTALVMEPYPQYRAPYEAGGSYHQGSADGSRPGVFFYNTHDLPSRFTSGMTTLYLHEGAPGHHFQISLAQEDASLPDFQRFGGNNAFVEGWALYAETLGYPMGFYKDPRQHWGTLDDEMLRAMRLVVDTGIHTKGWSRERAIAYMLANSGMGRTDATTEVDRYIANPAQAVSYKIGAMSIQRLRAQAEKALGKRFDIRAFHAQVLGSGALPLPILEAKIARWIASRR